MAARRRRADPDDEAQAPADRRQVRGADRGAVLLTPERREVLAREQAHHDRLAAELDASAMPPRAPDEWEAAILAASGDVRGRDVLELGCGDGGLSLVLLERGARLTALDVSPGMVAVAEERARRFRPGSAARFLTASAEETGLPAQSCDLVVGKWVLHHLDLPSAAAELSRVLRPGATAVFMETNARNPVLRWARRRLTGRFGVARVGTHDEEPLGPVDVALLRERFAAVNVSFPVFQLLQILDRQVLRYRWPRVTRACRRLDAWIAARFPWARPYGHWMLVELRR